MASGTKLLISLNPRENMACIPPHTHKGLKRNREDIANMYCALPEVCVGFVLWIHSRGEANAVHLLRAGVASGTGLALEPGCQALSLLRVHPSTAGLGCTWACRPGEHQKSTWHLHHKGSPQPIREVSPFHSVMLYPYTS